MTADNPRHRGMVPSADIYGQRPQHQRDEGYWPQAGVSGYSRVVAGNQAIPQSLPLGATPNGPGIGILQQAFRECEPRTLTLGISVGNAQLGSAFPVVPFNGLAFASTSAGMVDSAGAEVNIAANIPYLACVLQYGSGSARQQCWLDWYQGSYNLPPCEFVSVAALPWGTWWNGIPLLNFNAVASVSPGYLHGAHVPTVTALGDFAAGVPRLFGTPANARAFEVTAVSPLVNTTITVRGAASGTRNLFTGVMTPGWTPLELDLGAQAIEVTSSAATILRLQYFMQL